MVLQKLKVLSCLVEPFVFNGCKSVELTNPSSVKSRLEEDDVCQMDTIDNLGRSQSITFVTESGLYDVIIRGDSEKAKPFRKWVTSEVLPSIRKTCDLHCPQLCAK